MNRQTYHPGGGRGINSRCVRACEEEGVESGDDGEDPHGPDEQLRPERHDGGDLGREHDGEDRGEAPDGELDAPVAGASLEQVEAAEEEDEGDVGDADEGDG